MTSEHEHGPAASGVVRHLVHCRPCRESLATMGDEDAAVAFLEAQRDEPGAVTTVDRVLASTATAGKQLVADLIYELAKGCLLSDEEFARLVKPVVAPREVDVVRQELEVTVSTVRDVDGRVATACREVPEVLADQEEMQRVAQDLLALLEKVEGKSARKVVLEGYAEMHRGDFAAGRWLMQCVLKEARTDAHWKRLAAIGHARASVRLDAYEEVEGIIADAVDGQYSGPILELYGVVAAAAQGSTRDAHERLTNMRQNEFAWTKADKRQAPILTAIIAEQLGSTQAEVAIKAGANA